MPLQKTIDLENKINSTSKRNHFAIEGSLRRLTQSGLAVMGWRAGSIITASISAIWTTRCLGPSNLGISAFVGTSAAFCNITNSLLPNTYLIRVYSNVKIPNGRKQIASLGTAVRVLPALLIVCGLVTSLTLNSIPANWILATIAGGGIIVLNAVNLSWILQAEEDQIGIYKSQFISSAFGMLIVIAFFRPGIAAGYDLVVQCASAIVMNYYILRRVQLRLIFDCDLFHVPVLLTHIKSAQTIYITGFVTYIYTQMELPLVGYLISTRELGIYRSAHSLRTAIQSVLAIIPMLLYPRFLAWKNESIGTLWRNQWRIFKMLCLVCLLALVALIFTSPIIYKLLYGKEFIRATWPFVILIIGQLVVVLNGIFVWGLWSLGEDRVVLKLTVIVALTSIVANIIVIPIMGMIGAATVNLLSEVFILLGAIIYSRKVCCNSI